MIVGALPCSGEVPRPEHPCPDQFRENWMTLNGEWQFEIDDTRDYQLHVLTEVLRNKLRKGTNTIALHSHKQRNATYLDLAILIDDGSPEKP